MAKKYKNNSKWAKFAPLILLIIFIALFVLSICQYYSGAAGYDKLEQREYTFVKYVIPSGKYGGDIEIYVKEEKKPLIGSPGFVKKAVNMDVVENAKAGDKLIVWVDNSISLFHSYNVHEGKINGKYFLRLEDYQKYHKQNDVGGIVICSVMLVIGLSVGIICFVVLRKK